MPRLVCTNIHSEQGTGSGCQCAGCQDAFGTAMLGGPEPAPANGSADVPGDLTTGISLTLGTPITGVLEVNGDHDWYAVDLVAGTRYQITLNGVAIDGYGALEDPYIYLRNASGNLIAQNDDIRNGVLRNSRLNWVATETGRYFLDAGAWNESFVGGYQLSIIEFVPPTYTLDEIADFLTTGFWGDGDRRWDISTDNIITYNVTGLTSAGQTLARAAFQSWSNVTNLVFEEVTSGGNINLDDNQSGAFASSSVSNGFITSAGINISIGWLNSYGTTIDSYSFQTYVHEIGHALGLGHGGAYNATATYGVDNLYQNDIWSYTIMSYFDQHQAGFGTYRFVIGPSLADIVAVHNHYGANTTFNSGDNVYGRNATAGSLYDFANYATAPAFTIYDTSGSDTLDASGYSADQTINLIAEAFSSIGGNINNISIARGVSIEGAIGGGGADSVLSSAGNNMLVGNAGADTLDGGADNDSLHGGAGGNSLIGGAGLDLVTYADLSDAVTVNLAINRATSAAGNDTLSGIENVLGGDGADSILGDAAANFLAGGNGADTLHGGAGADSLIGGAGLDLVTYADLSDAVTVNLAINRATSAAGNDTFSGIENVLGGDGADSILGDAVANFLAGGNGADTLIAGDAAGQRLYGAGLAMDEAGTDSLVAGSGDNQWLSGGAGADTLRAGIGNAQELLGGTGNDWLVYDQLTEASQGVTVDLSLGTSFRANIAHLLNGIENVLGGAGADSLFGNAATNALDGGANSDTLNGGAGDDRLIGGDGFDIADYGSALEAFSTDLAIGLASGSGLGSDTLIGIEGILGGQGNDNITGDAANNMLSGNAGDDTLMAGNGNDSLAGGAGNDMLIADGVGDYLNGGDGDDVVLLGATQLADILALFGAQG